MSSEVRKLERVEPILSDQPYDPSFFEAHHAGSLASAREVIALVLNLVGPTSVVDVGCGTGTWLSVVKASGVSDVLGIDGDYVDRTALEIDPSEFMAADLSEPLALSRTFDLVMCLEVAEHLPAERADTLVTSLVRLGPVILFSAAIPLQGGTAHVNEQWPEYWAHRFNAGGFDVFDAIRPLVWRNERVEPWYAQNTLLYIRRGQPLTAKLETWRSSPGRLSLVHPRFFMEARSKAEAALQGYAWSEKERARLRTETEHLTVEIERLTVESERLTVEIERLTVEIERLREQMASSGRS